MDARDALRFSAYYHALALVASLLGAAVAAVGLYLGLRGALGAATLTNPTSLLGAVAPSGLAIAGAGIVAGLYVRRVGRTAARIKVETTAVEQGVDTPSTSVISRKVGREVGNQVSQTVSEAVAEAVPSSSGFQFGDGDDSAEDVAARADETPADD